MANAVINSLFHVPVIVLWQTGFMEYLEEICDINTIRWSFEYKKNGQVKLQDDGLRVSATLYCSGHI